MYEDKEALSILYENLKKHRISALIAPTSYGKTMFSPVLLKRAREDSIGYGLIHVVPYRALVREIYLEKFRDIGNKFTIGYQSMDEFEEGRDKSPFFLRDLVVSTIDSYVWNAFGVPVAEFDNIVNDVSLGHGYVAGMSIFTSVNVFDEAHVYLGAGSDKAVFTMVQASIAYLSYMKVPTVIESATVPSTKLRFLKKTLSEDHFPLVYVCKTSDCSYSIQSRKYREILGGDFKPISDKDWYDYSLFKWRTYLLTKNKAIAYASELCKSKPVLIIRNTISDAINTYRELKDKCPKITLLHSMIGARDREEKIKSLKDIIERIGAIVATQVIEAGVEAEALAIFSDIAPIENLAQRVGRLCRRKTTEKCREEDIEVIIIEDGFYEHIYDSVLTMKSLEKLKKRLDSQEVIDWRLLENIQLNGAKRISFTELMEEVYEETKDQGYGLTTIDALKKALELDLPSTIMLEVLEGILKDDILGVILLKLVPGDDKDNFIAVEITKLHSLIRNKREQLSRCLRLSKNDSFSIHVETTEGDVDIEIDIKSFKDPFNLIRKLYYETRKIFRSMKGKEHFVIKDYYILLDEKCYSGEYGALYDVV